MVRRSQFLDIYKERLSCLCLQNEYTNSHALLGKQNPLLMRW